MKAYRWQVSTGLMLTLLLGSSAQAEPLTGLSSGQLPRLSRDLVPSSSEDFFRKGREQFERQIERLNRLPTSSDQVLKVDQGTQYQKLDDRSNFSEPSAPSSGEHLKSSK
jgi:hypothetical protein